jgi:hypothetical protein
VEQKSGIRGIDEMAAELGGRRLELFELVDKVGHWEKMEDKEILERPPNQMLKFLRKNELFPDQLQVIVNLPPDRLRILGDIADHE